MGHGSNNYFAVKLKGSRGIVWFWGLDRRFPVLGSPKNQTAPLFGGAARIEVRGRSGLALERLHVFSLEAFGATHQVELHGLASCKLRNPFERMAEKCTKTSAPELRLIKP